jgi:hypothetical protein
MICILRVESEQPQQPQFVSFHIVGVFCIVAYWWSIIYVLINRGVVATIPLQLDLFVVICCRPIVWSVSWVRTCVKCFLLSSLRTGVECFLLSSLRTCVVYVVLSLSLCVSHLLRNNVGVCLFIALQHHLQQVSHLSSFATSLFGCTKFEPMWEVKSRNTIFS